MKHIILACAFLFAFGAQAAETPIRTISVTGLAERKVVPDEAHLMVNLNSLNKDLKTARAEHDKKLRQLLAIVEKAGIDSKKVKTESSNVQPDYTYTNNQRVFRGYRVQSLLDVTVQPIAKVGSVMEAITNAGFERNSSTEWGDLLSLRYGISQPERVREEMMVLAIQNARMKAEKMAKAAGARLGDVYQLSEGGGNFQMPPPMPMYAARGMAVMEQASAKDAMAPPAGENHMQATVSVIYELR